MYAGHVGFAIAATARRPDVPVAVYIGASLLPDLVVHPIGHTIPGALVLAIGAGIIAAVRWDAEASMLIAALVALHFGVDLLTSNLHIFPGTDVEFGLGLYDLPAVDFVLEAGVIVLVWFAWRRSVPNAAPARTRPMLSLLLLSQLFFSAFIAAGANGR